MRGWFLAVVTTVAAVSGCDKWGHRLDKMEEWKDTLCACDTPACVVNTQRDYEAWWRSVTEKDSVNAGSPARPGLSFVAIPESKKARYDELRDAMRACAKQQRIGSSRTP